jgi:vacuolar-type H+-ATPase subunit D/Vma8
LAESLDATRTQSDTDIKSARENIAVLESNLETSTRRLNTLEQVFNSNF